jgi:hypothetical protein
MRTQAEILAEADTLETMKPTVRSSSAFGDDHHAAIDAQVQVLRDRMTQDDIYDTWGDEDADDFAQNVLDEALATHEWMHGHGPAPHEGWADLVR